MSSFNMYDQKKDIEKKIFIIKRSELEGRIDPLYYNSDLTKFNSGKFPSVLLRSVVNSIKSGTGAGKNEQAIDENGIIQIRPTNIDNNGFLKFDKNIYLPFESKYNLLEKGDVLFNNTNSQDLVGKTAILKEKLSLTHSNHITAIKPKKEFLHSEYLWIILNLYQKNKIFYAICTNWNNQSGIGNEVLNSLRIPLPSLEQQQQIVNHYERAYKQKQQKESKALLLLRSIDNYLLNELGVILPKKENNLQSRIFTTNFREITSGRFDPKLYSPATTNLKLAINNIDLKRFKTFKLKDLLIQSIAGDWGVDDEDVEIEGFKKCLVIRATEFDNDFNLNVDNSRVKYRLIKNSKIDILDIKEGDLLIEKSGGSPDQPVGRIAIIEKDLTHFQLGYSNFIHKIRVNKDIINPTYLFCFLKTIHNIKLTESMQSQTNGIRNLIMQTYLGQNIIVPINQKGVVDIDKQEKIAKYIQDIRLRAQNLQREASEILLQAQQQLEQIILGL